MKVFMVHAELLAFPHFQSFSSPLPGAVAALGAWTANAAAYTPLAHDVARDVQQFIAQGGGAPAASIQSVQAQWLAMQALKQRDAVEKKNGAKAASSVSATTGAQSEAFTLQPQQQAFLSRIAPWAQEAAQRLGVSVRSVMAHAALESGWGQRPVRSTDGADSLNLFGIKAHAGWEGARTAAWTTEFEDGQPVQQSQDFRRYTGLDETFADYVRLLERSPRYRAALHTGEDVQAFAQALADGGYATDPQYAQKLLRVSRSIASVP